MAISMTIRSEMSRSRPPSSEIWDLPRRQRAHQHVREIVVLANGDLQNHKHQMKEDHPSPHTNLTYTHLLLRRANPFMQQLLPMMLQAPPQRNTDIQPKDSSPKAQRERLCSYLQQAVDLAEATAGDFDDDSIGDEQESSPQGVKSGTCRGGRERTNIFVRLRYWLWRVAFGEFGVDDYDDYGEWRGTNTLAQA
jgi:hypothetical protein